MKFQSGYILLFLVVSLGGIFRCTTPLDLNLERAPYLQSAIADSISILWRTNIGSACEVKYKNQNTGDWITVAGVTRKTNTGVIENEVVINGLAPNSSYAYQIFTDASKLGEAFYSFKSPRVATDTSFTFFAVGDIGEPVEEDGTPDQLGKALAQMKEEFDLGLLLGDIIYPNGESELYDTNLFMHFTEVFPYVPVFPVLGNHDWHEPEENYIKEWRLPHNEHYYSFNFGNIHFIALDTKNGELYDYDNQVAWFKDDLQSEDALSADWQVVFLHHNGISCTYKEAYEGVVSLYPIFAENGVDLVLNGHAHTYERLNPMDGAGTPVVYPDSINSFTSITIGSGGKLRGVGTDPKPFSPDPENCKYPGLVAKAVHDWAFLKLEVDGKTIRGRAYTTEGLEVVDEFILTSR